MVNDLDAAPGDAVAAEIGVFGGEAAIAAVGSVLRQALLTVSSVPHGGAFGGLDIIVNNVGYTWDATIQKATDDRFQAMLDVIRCAVSAFCAPPPS